MRYLKETVSTVNRCRPAVKRSDFPERMEFRKTGFAQISPPGEAVPRGRH